MSEPVADHVPPLPPMPTERLDVDATLAEAVDLDSAAAATEGTPAAPTGRHRTEEPEPLTRAQRRAQAEAASSRRGRSTAKGESSVLDHPVVLVGLSVLTLAAVVVGFDQASQGNVVALLPAVLLVAAYVVVVRRRRARR